MYVLAQAWEQLDAFFDLGGPVLYLIFAAGLLMWTMILERLDYFYRLYPRDVRATERAWMRRDDRSSWEARQIRRMLIDDVALKLERSLGMIQTMVALCPLLGLLGTITGMIEVFDIMAVAGSGNPRAMASGVSRATIPTMAGMVMALSGLYFSVWMKRFAAREAEKLEDRLVQPETSVEG